VHLIGVHSHRLHHLSSLTDNTLDALLETLSSLRGSGRSLTKILGIWHDGVVLGGVGVNLVGAFLLDELGEILNGAVALVCDGVGLVAGDKELEGGEALDLIRNVVGGGVDLGDGDLGGGGLE
jgi:hypothetical protein